MMYGISKHLHSEYGEFGDIIPDSLTIGDKSEYRADLVSVAE